MRRLILVPLFVILGVLAIVGGLGYWFLNNYNYYSTDDAQVSGQVVNISSPQAGQLATFSAQVGDTVSVNQAVATISATSATGTRIEVPLTSPIAGTIVQVSAVQGQGVTPGLSIVQIANLSNLQVVAYVDESAISNVKKDQQVDVKIDAYSGTTYTGHVDRIVQATAGTFSLLPSSDNASGNFTKVAQRIPVIVTLDGGTGTNDIVPGMSANVTIHLH